MVGKPLLLANVHDGYSAKLVASNPKSQAIATGSGAIALSQGVEDDDMTLDQNLQGIKYVAAGLRASGRQHELPLTADLQDGYDDPAETVRRSIDLGVVGCNIEDVVTNAKPTPTLRSIEDATNRVKAMVDAAKSAGVPDYVVNARVDVLAFGGTINEVVERGKAYLEAGAASIFVLGFGKHNITKEEIVDMVNRLDGKLALHPGGLSMKDLRDSGVCRISVGSLFYRKAMDAFRSEAVTLLEG